MSGDGSGAGKPVLWFAAALLLPASIAPAQAAAGSSSIPSGTCSQDCAPAGSRRRCRAPIRIDITVIVSFNREGDILGRPRITYESEQASDNDRLHVPDRRDGGVATLHAVAIYRSTGRRHRRPALRSSIQNRKLTTQTHREESMADTENTLILETTQGPVTIEMRPDLAPGHVARIKELVREGFYDGIVFHRVIEGFMAQTGCPQGTGTGGSGKKLKAEFNKEPHVRGTTSMARAASPDSGDSQFFICFDDASFLNNQYTVWGKVTSRHGERRQDQARRAGAESRTRSSRRTWRRTRLSRSVIPGARDSANPESRRRTEPHGFERARASLTDDGGGVSRHAHRSLRLRTSRRTASRCGRRARAIPRACWWCRPTRVLARPHRCATFRNGCEPGDQLVVNDTKVISAQLKGRRIGRDTEPKIEATLIKRLDGSRWQALVKPAKKLSPGDVVRFGNEGKVCFLGHLDAAGRSTRATTARSRCRSRFTGRRSTRRSPISAARRCRPTSPRKRAPDERDAADYQTMFARQRGRGRGADGGTAFYAGAGGGVARARRRDSPGDAACRGRDVPAGQGRGHRRAPDACRMGRHLRGRPPTR